MIFHATILLLEMDKKEESDPLILPRSIKAILNFFPSANNTTLEPLALAVEILIQNCLDDVMRSRLEEIYFHSGDVTQTAVHHILTALKDSLGYQYQFSWGHILLLIAQVFEATGRTCCDLPITRSILATVEEIMKDETQAEHRQQATKTIIGALKASGAEKLLQIFPLNLHLEPGHQQRREWLLPILSQYTRGSSLCEFENLILPDIQRIASLLPRAPNQILPSLYKQLWSLFPSFCQSASNTARAFKSLAKGLGMTLKDQSLARSMIARGITTLIRQNHAISTGKVFVQSQPSSSSSSEASEFSIGAQKQASEEGNTNDNNNNNNSSSSSGSNKRINKIPLPKRKKQEMTPLHVITQEEAHHNIQTIGSFSKNFLPILFNCVTSIELNGAENSIVRKDIFDLIESFLSISPADLLNTFFKNLITKLAEASREQALFETSSSSSSSSSSLSSSSSSSSSEMKTEGKKQKVTAMVDERQQKEQKKRNKEQKASISKSFADYTELGILFVP